MDFPSPVFQTVDRLTTQTVPLSDFKTAGFRTVTRDEMQTQTNKK